MTRRPEPPSRERQGRGGRLADGGAQCVDESAAQRELLARIAIEHPWTIRILIADQWAGSPPEFAAAIIAVRTMLTELGVAPQQIAALLAAPRDSVRPAQIEQWHVLCVGEETLLFGRVTGHPTVIDGHRVLSTCIVSGPTQDRLVLTRSGQLYRLRQRASRPPDDVSIDAIARILAETATPDDQRGGGWMCHSVPRVGEAADRCRRAGERRPQRDRFAPAQAPQPIGSEPAVPPPGEAAPIDGAADTPQEASP